MGSSSERSSSSAATANESSSDGEKMATRPSTKEVRRSSTEPSSSVKRPLREPQEEGASKAPSSKKRKRAAQGEIRSKGKEAEKSAKKGAAVWSPEDETAFLKSLLACCQNGKALLKNLGAFYEVVKKDLSNQYSNEQLYTKYKGLRNKFRVATDKFKDLGCVGFKNAHQENLYKFSYQIWGDKEDDEELFGTVKASKRAVDVRAKKKKNNDNKSVVPESRREREEVKMVRKEHKEGVGQQNMDVMKIKKKREEEEIAHISEDERSEEKGKEEEGDEDDDDGGEEDDSTKERQVESPPSNTWRATTGLHFSMINGRELPRRELPTLSEAEAEMLDHKWRAQQLIEMEVASKHLALLQEELQLRMAKFRHH